MIYVLEVPHRGSPMAWEARDWADYRSRVFATWGDASDAAHDEWRDANPGASEEVDLAEIRRIAGDDCSYYAAVDGPAAARALVRELRRADAPRIGQCGPARAAAALAGLLK